ncbi:MAG: S-layer homology domain-containing protein [Oscillospiraceae bacterium]|nr:S-layer homology domain-containing protein [Oscillospiraceae bacterium]
MKGMEEDLFAPKGTTTRAQFATVIYRMAGSPEVTEADYAKCPFTDLVDEWYKDAVVWAYNAKVVTGVSDTTFVPGAKITREQMVAMLYRFSGDTGASADLSKITDADTISDYAKPAVAWAVANGVVAGFPDGTFRPNSNATRAQMAAIIARFDRA